MVTSDGMGALAFTLSLPLSGNAVGAGPHRPGRSTTKRDDGKADLEPRQLPGSRSALRDGTVDRQRGPEGTPAPTTASTGRNLNSYLK